MKFRSLGMLAIIASVSAMMSYGDAVSEEVRKSILAGSWYEGNKKGLAAQVDGYLEKVTPSEIGGRILGLISPHAGYFYSGQAAAYGYAQIKGKSYNRVIVIAPSHRFSFGGISILDVTHYETPLGKIPLDVKNCRKLLEMEGFSTVAQAHAQEHSLEIQLPFLQRVLGDFELVPMVVGNLRRSEYPGLSDAIRSIVDENTLIVASSDFTHYGDRFGYLPFRDNVQENLRKLDMGAVDLIEKKDREGFLDYKAETGATICGAAAIALLIGTLPEAAVGKTLTYYTSGDVTGEWDSSVSYVSMALFEPRQSGEHDGGLSGLEQEVLLNLARETLETYAQTGKLPVLATDDPRLTELLKSRRGVFVTLNTHGRLRGCIGHIIPRFPLYQGVIENAFNAGWRDHRFPQLRESEIPDLQIEVSVLTVPRKVSSPDEIVIGKHGVILEKGSHSAVYLPQVAPEQGWDVEETLTHLSMKAGLPADGWRDGAEFSVFSAQVFHE
ncbi:MAG: AmmeMemoRadiSam system protein B [Candidatus Eisenbacteria sp.]|nr:AmmeMemoRadiSam system protein B [Candidatus Eisenbacteria bacterium]